MADAFEFQPWTMALRRYLFASLLLHLCWEIVQLPLYDLWVKGTNSQIAFAVVHCTLGDMMIAGLALLVTLAILAPERWPNGEQLHVWLIVIFVGVAYTIYSEWLNVNVRRSWSYGYWMPTLPVFGTGLAPLAQWVVVPTVALWLATRSAPESKASATMPSR